MFLDKWTLLGAYQNELINHHPVYHPFCESDCIGSPKVCLTALSGCLRNKCFRVDSNFFHSFFWLQFEPVITPHNISLVHHILVYACGDASVLPSGIDDCYGANPDFALCSQVLVGWAVGGEVSLQGTFPSPFFLL